MPGDDYNISSALPKSERSQITRKRDSQDLFERPKFGIRTRLILSFLFIFGFAAIINIWIIYTLSVLQNKTHFLEVADSYMNEIQQARRFEKNYLLYGTNLEDALEHVGNARKLLNVNESMVSNVVSKENYRMIVEHTSEYDVLLQKLGNHPSGKVRIQIENQLREHGSTLVAFAGNFSAQEKKSVDQTFILIRHIPRVFLGILFVMMLAISILITRPLLNALSRFMSYTDRIGKGDFTHITPRRKYRDEFTQLAHAFNHMIDELEYRHQIMVESHKIRAIGSLVAGVAHELNNPLNNVMLTASTIMEDYEDYDKDEKVEMIEEIIGEAERARRIVRNLLDFAKEQEINLEPLNLVDVVHRSAQLVSNQMKISKVCLKVDIPENLPPIHGDGQLLCQVFVNLLLNALQAIPEKGVIRINADGQSDKGFVKVNVIDNGPGITRAYAAANFRTVFYDERKGNGIGVVGFPGDCSQTRRLYPRRKRSGSRNHLYCIDS